MSGRYAENTSVSEAQSRVEVERTLKRYGCDQFMYATEAQGSIITFRIEGRYYRLALPHPTPDDDCVAFTPQGRERSPSQIQVELDKELRRRWRVFALYIKAMLEATETGIIRLEEVLLPFALLPDNTTVADHALPSLDESYATGNAPKALLPPSVQKGFKNMRVRAKKNQQRS